MYFDARAAKQLKAGQSLAIEGCPGLRIVAGKTVKTWIYRHRNAVGQLKQVKLGLWPDMPVQEAAAAWSSLRAARDAGADLVGQKKAQKAEAKRVAELADTHYRVERLVKDYIKGHLRKHRSELSADAGESTLLRVLKDHPELAHKPAEAITRQDAFGVVEARQDTPTAAQKLRSLMGAAWDYALDAGRIDGATPNWWRLVMRGRLKSKGKIVKGEHVGRERRVLSESELATLLQWLPNMHKLGADVVCMYLWTVTRGSEILHMRPEHVAVDGLGVMWWTIPKALTKNANVDIAVDLRVPLFGRAREIVERRVASVGSNGWLFTGVNGKRYTQKSLSVYIYDLQPYSEKSQRPGRIRGVLPVTNWSAHNLRRTSRTLIASMGCTDEIGEALLGHVPSEITATYNAYSYDAERVFWLDKLSRKLEGLFL